MRPLALLAAALSIAALGAFLGVRLARRATPPPEPAPLAPLTESRSARRPVEVPTTGPGPTGEEPPSALEARWSELNRMAIRALEAGDLERAVAFFQQCAEGVPDEPVFRRRIDRDDERGTGRGKFSRTDVRPRDPTDLHRGPLHRFQDAGHAGGGARSPVLSSVFGTEGLCTALPRTQAPASRICIGSRRTSPARA